MIIQKAGEKTETALYPNRITVTRPHVIGSHFEPGSHLLLSDNSQMLRIPRQKALRKSYISDTNPLSNLDYNLLSGVC
jgi:hypothetical protein